MSFDQENAVINPKVPEAGTNIKFFYSLFSHIFSRYWETVLKN